jgi:hypothetical protein
VGFGGRFEICWKKMDHGSLNVERIKDTTPLRRSDDLIHMGTRGLVLF